MVTGSFRSYRRSNPGMMFRATPWKRSPFATTLHVAPMFIAFRNLPLTVIKFLFQIWETLTCWRPSIARSLRFSSLLSWWRWSSKLMTSDLPPTWAKVDQHLSTNLIKMKFLTINYVLMLIQTLLQADPWLYLVLTVSYSTIDINWVFDFARSRVMGQKLVHSVQGSRIWVKTLCPTTRDRAGY